MAFVAEDGSGLSNSNSYIDTTFANTYHSDRGHDAWNTFSGQQKRQALVRATDYIDKRFGHRFRGMRRAKDQALEWPRLDAFDEDEFLYSEVDIIPRKLQQATAEYALRAALVGELAPDAPKPVQTQDLSTTTEQSGDVTTGQVKSESVQVGPVKESKSYVTASEAAKAKSRSSVSSTVSDTNIPEYPGADLLLEELLIPPGTGRVIRGS